jgi:hypothetical protein
VAASGPVNLEQWQRLTFKFTPRNPALYTTPPSVTINGTTGTLTFVASRAISGRDTVDYVLKDNGGTLNGGIDSTVGRLIINITGVANSRPGLNISAANAALTYPPVVGGTITLNNWLTNLTKGPASEAWQTLTVTIRPKNPTMYAVSPTAAVVANGANLSANLNFTLSGVPGQDSLIIVLRDNGGSAFGGLDSIVRKTALTVTVNVAPSFLVSAANTTLNYPSNSTQAVSLASWCTALTKGPAAEATQTLSFSIVSKKPTLYTSAPVVVLTGPSPTTGTLNFTLAGVNGEDTLSVKLKDNGGSFGGGVDTLVKTFYIYVGSVGLAANIPAEQVSIYPNPTSGLIQIDLSGLSNATPVLAKLTNLIGQSVWEGELNAQSKNQLSIEGSASGMYLLHLEQDGKHLVHKIKLQ